MAKPFEKWPKEIPDVRKKVQVVRDNGEIFESIVVKRGTPNGRLYYIVLQDGTFLKIDPVSSLANMEMKKTDNGPLWSISVENQPGVLFGSHLEPANLFILD